MGFFDFFKNMFKKQNCTFCGKECGIMGRDKIKGDEYICNECRRGASRHIRVSRFTKEELAAHMEYMKRSDKVFKEVLGGFEGNGKCIPHPTNNQTFQFFDDYGMFVIRERRYDTDENYPVELFRYDQLASYEPYYEDRETEPGKPREFVEGGIKLRFVGTENMSSEIRPGANAHPYIRDEIKVCLGKGTGGKTNFSYAENIVAHFDYIFGVNDDRKGLFGFGMSKEEQRNLQGGIAMVNTFVDAVKIAKAGQTELTEEQQAQFDKNKAMMDDAQTGGLAKYTRAADEAWNKVQ